jgi:hypothetical protein
VVVRINYLLGIGYFATTIIVTALLSGEQQERRPADFKDAASLYFVNAYANKAGYICNYEEHH